MKLDAFCHVMPRPYADALAKLDSTPAAYNIRNRIEGIPSLVDLDLNLGSIRTLRNLKSGLEACFAYLDGVSQEAKRASTLDSARLPRTRSRSSRSHRRS